MSNLIDRQKLIDVSTGLVLYADLDGKTKSYSDGLTDAYNLICQVPSAQPETAKRIVGKSRGCMTLWHRCDTCNEPVDAQDNFCCGCGRRLTDG
jgi:hypothetical protein